MKVAFVGAGFIMKDHLAAYRRLASEGRDIQVVGLCDKSEAVRTRYASEFPCFEEFDDLIANAQPDLIDICAPTFLHRSFTERAFAAGCHVLCEKPMSLTGEDCAAMIDASKRAGKSLMVAHPMRFYEPYHVIEKYLSEKPFGEARSAFFHRCDCRPARPGNWILKEKFSGGVTLDLAIHDTDAMRMFFGDPIAVQAAAIKSDDIDIYDSASYNFQYPRLYVNLYNEWSMEGNLHMTRFFRVNFENGYLIFDGDDMVVRAVSNGHEVAVYDCKGDDCYYNEIAYYTDCIEKGLAPERCMPEESRKSILLCRKAMSTIIPPEDMQ